MRDEDYWARLRAIQPRHEGAQCGLGLKEDTMEENEKPGSCMWKNAPRPDSMMDDVELRARGALVQRGVAPAMRPPAEVMIWGTRVFVHAQKRYEGPGPLVYEEGIAAHLLPKPERVVEPGELVTAVEGGAK